MKKTWAVFSMIVVLVFSSFTYAEDVSKTVGEADHNLGKLLFERLSGKVSPQIDEDDEYGIKGKVEDVRSAFKSLSSGEGGDGEYGVAIALYKLIPSLKNAVPTYYYSNELYDLEKCYQIEPDDFILSGLANNKTLHAVGVGKGCYLKD